MVSKSRNKISPEIKSQVLSELQVPGCIVSNLAKSYNVSILLYILGNRKHERLV